MSDSSFLLQAFTQSYDWGKKGATSKVAQYAQASTPGFDLQADKPYAELWMGTHPTLPSKSQDGTPLPTILKDNPGLLGSRSHSDLPFLFKILSIHKALSIQSHPDKPLAERLHREHPDIYKDDNHKPEMAIALTPFKAMCGFLPASQIASNLTNTPELSSLILPSNAQNFLNTLTTHPSNSSEPSDVKAKKQALKELFTSLMTASPETTHQQLESLSSRYINFIQNGKGLNKGEDEGLVQLVLDLMGQFPGDIGIFCVFVLNIVLLQPGEAIFLGAGEPHAYISGDVVECMATSDNVLRAGLTPKQRDVRNLLESLTYNMSTITKHEVAPKPWGGDDGQGKTLVYDPPVEEFSVLRVRLEEGETEHHRSIDGPSIVIVTSGKAEMVGGTSVMLEEGNVLFIGAGEEVVWKARGGAFEAFRAFCE